MVAHSIQVYGVANCRHFAGDEDAGTKPFQILRSKRRCPLAPGALPTLTSREEYAERRESIAMYDTTTLR